MSIVLLSATATTKQSAWQSSRLIMCKTDIRNYFDNKVNNEKLEAEIIELKNDISKGKDREGKHKEINKALRLELKEMKNPTR